MSAAHPVVELYTDHYMWLPGWKREQVWQDVLGPVIRRAFLLYQLDDLSLIEIATRLGVSIPTVKRYVVKALVVSCLDELND